MGSEAEPAKALLPYLQRADELQKHEPLVAYYCRMYAMERGLKIPTKERTKTTNSILVSLMKQLEKDKKSLKLGPEDNLYVEGFASNVFAKADKQDRAGRADLSTAKTFYAASIFFEILSQFGELQPDIEQKQKYAIWKAADIRKALKEGRKPIPGPPGGDQDDSLPSESNSYDMGSDPSYKQDGASSSHFEEKTFQRNESLSTSQPPDLPSQYSDKFNPQDFNRNDRVGPHDLGHTGRVGPHDYGHTENSSPQGFSPAPGPPSSYSRSDYHENGNPQDFSQAPSYPTNDYHGQHPPPARSDYPAYSQNYDQPPYTPEINPYSYPNFQSYPSFQESSFPAAPTHQPSYYHGPDASVPHQSQPAPPSNYPTTVQYNSAGGSGNHVESNTAAQEAYHYDSNYQPSVEKIAEAHKSARFAVASLAFDDVSTAVEHLRRSLELLTKPSSTIH